MSIVTLLLFIVILGVIAYFVEAYIPMSEPFKMLFRVIVVIVVILLLLNAFGIVGPTVPRLTQ